MRSFLSKTATTVFLLVFTLVASTVTVNLLAFEANSSEQVFSQENVYIATVEFETEADSITDEEYCSDEEGYDFGEDGNEPDFVYIYDIDDDYEYEEDDDYFDEEDDDYFDEEEDLVNVNAAEVMAVSAPSAMVTPFSAISIVAHTWADIENAITSNPGTVLDIVISQPITAGNTINIPAGMEVFLRSNLLGPGTFSIDQDTANNRHFIVDGGILNLGNINLTRTIPSAVTPASGGVRVENGGQLHMHNHSVISNNRSATNGGGVSVSQGTFVMNGESAIISNNEAPIGGGVWVGNDAIFTMEVVTDGSPCTIVGNRATGTTAAQGGGGVFVTGSNSVFAMSAGDIEENVAINGGGVYIGDSTFNLDGGTISSNRANNGGGVRVQSGGTVTMTGGTISHHTERAVIQANPDHVRPWGIGDGGGIFLANGTLNLEGGVISHNRSANGSGIRANVPSIIHMTGGTIENNGARGRVGHPNLVSFPNMNYNGSGIFLGSGSAAPSPNSATLIMKGGYIQNNIGTNGAGILAGASTSPDNPVHAEVEIHGGYIRNNQNFYHTGGGIDIRPTGLLTMYGGEISGNSAVHGGGILLNGATFHFHGGDILNNSAHVHPHGRILGGGDYAGGPGGSGGGIQVGWWQGGGTQSSIVEMTGINSNVSGNKAELFGGGIYLAGTNSALKVASGHVTNSHAEKDGGGIFTDNYDYNNTLSTEAYSNLDISAAVVFSGNTAGNGAFMPPANPETTNIAFPAAGSGPSDGVPGLHADPVQGHTLNNYDINFHPVAHTVTYTVTGTAPADVTNMPTSPQTHNEGSTVTVAGILQTTSTTNAAGTEGRWTFNGWSHPTISQATFTMPSSNVEFTGSWTFTPSERYFDSNPREQLPARRQSFGTSPAQPPTLSLLTPPTPTPAPTPTPTLTSEVSVAEALYRLNLFVGTGIDADGNPIFELNRQPTRLEALALVIRLMGQESEAMAYTGNNQFTDVPAWGARYAAFGYNTGITFGINDEHTLFAPDRQVTAHEFTTFLLRVLGYSEANRDFIFEEAMQKASSIGFFNPFDITRISTNNFLRGHAVLAIANSLMTPTKGSNEYLLNRLAEQDVFSRYDADWFKQNIS